MKVCYDLHIHSALSPCADNDMTPVNIVAKASAAGIEMLAVADHNSIKNVKATMAVGEMLGVTVVPAMELQTKEEIHFLCLFEKFVDLNNFYNSIEFTKMKNREEIFGQQLIVNEDDEVVGHEDSLLLMSSNIAEYEISNCIKKFNGVAVPAHINREANGILAILGTIPNEYGAVELSSPIDKFERDKYVKDCVVIIDSDSHTLQNIGQEIHIFEIEDKSSKALLKYLNGGIN
ncbi:MAG: PHP domain-containing protein [Clostridia bacterium]